MKVIKEIAHMASEYDVRKLRSNIYGECSDNNWIHCRDNWMHPDSIRWLIDHQPDNHKP